MKVKSYLKAGMKPERIGQEEDPAGTLTVPNGTG